MIAESKTHYCPFCQRHLEPEKDEYGDVILIEGGMVYLHDEVIHDEDYKFEELQ